MNHIQVLETFFIAGVVSYLITPFIRMLAIRLNYLDHPKDSKVHAHPTPLLGGVAMFAAFIVAIVTKESIISLSVVKAVIAGAFILLVTGLIDDKIGMMPKLKLLGQFLAAMVAIKAGLRIEIIGNYYLSVMVTYVWIIGITNAVNLSDNMNGLSAGIVAMSAFFFGVISYMNGQPAVSSLSFALAGCALGFLKHNFPKANLFMGDAGSLVLGYLLACIAIWGSWKTYVWTTSLMIPILILGYPIFDTILVSVMRTIEGRPIFLGGKDHASHRLALLGFKRYGAVLVVYTICFVLGVVAVIITKVGPAVGITLGAASFIAMIALGVRLSLVDTKRFGRKKALNGSD